MDANEAGSVPSDVGTQLPQNAESSSRSVMGFFKLIFAHKAISIITIVLLVIIGVAIFAGQKLYQANKATSPVASRFDDQKIPLGSAVAPGALQLNTSQALSINGQLRANNTLVLSPSTQPTRGTAGQLYYDSTTSRILYHNGQAFVAVADTTQTDQIQTQLQGTASQDEVASIAQQLQAIQAELGQIQVPDNIAQLDGVNNFSAQNTFTTGLTAANLSVSGATNLGPTSASSLILSNSLAVTSGGTGQSSLPLNGVLVGQGTSPVAAVTAGAAGQCLISTAGAPVFQACPGGSGGGVDTLNGLSGALTLANASAAGSTITINDATTASKGIASFNASNFSVSGGAVNTIQNISTTAAPLFNGLTVTNNLTAGTLSGDGTNVTNVNAAQLGGQVATFYLNASNISSGTLNDARLSANIAQYNAPTANFTGTLQQGGNDVCTTAGNCSGVGGSGTAGTIAVWTGSGFTLADSLLSQSGGVVTAAGDLTVSGDVTATNLQGNGAGVTNVNAAQLNGQTAAYYLNATNINSGTLADARLSSNVTLQGNVFNGAGQLVQLNASSQLPSVSGALLTSLNASNISSGTLSDARLSSNVALLSNAVNFTGGALQFNGSDVCTTAGNCAGVGGGVTTTGGTAGTLAVFDGAGFSIVDSLVSQSGTTVTISGDLVATSLAGDGTAVTNVNAAQLNGQGAAYYLNATNINAGTLNDARLSSNVTLQGNTFNGANQLVQLDATGALPALDGSNLLNVNAALLGGQNGAYYLDLANATGTLNDARLSSNVALFDTATANFTGTLQQGGNNVCTTAGNCIGSGAVGGSGTPGTIAVWDGSGFTLTDSLLSQSGTTVTVGGDLVADNLQGNGAGVTNVNAVQLNGQTAAYYLNASNVNAGTLADARLSANVTLQGNVFNGAGQLVQLNASSQLPAVSGALLTDLDADQISSGTLSDARLSSNVALYNAATANFTGTLQQGGNNVCTTAGNCAGVGGGVTTPGGTAGQLAVFSGAQTIVDSIISDNGSTVTIGGMLAVNTITPTAAMTIGSTSQALTLQGNGSTQLSVTAAGTTNSLSFAAPSGANKSVVIPNASGTVVVSASGPLSIDANGNISCATCTTSGGGSGGAVDSLNGLNGALNLANASGSGSTITIDDASTTAKGIASFNSSNFTVSAGAVNTVQNISVTSAPSFAGLTLSGNLSIGTNSIVTGGATIGSTELDVLDGGIDETEVTGVITDVTAGSGLTGGGASGNATLNVVSANGGIVVTPDNIALTLQPSGDGLSTTTSSGSGLEILAGGVTLLQGCSDGQILKWNETADTWGCAADAGGAGLGDDVLVNGSNASGANFLDTASSGTSTGVTWALNTTPSPNEVTVSIANASVTQAGSVTTGVQSFAGDKTFNNAATIAGLFTANGNITLETGDTITVNGDAISDFTGTGLTMTGGALQTTLGTTIDSSEIVDGTIVGTDIAAATIANSNLVNSSLTVSAGNGLINGGAVSLGGSTTLNIASANGGIAVNADNIALTLQPTGDALSSTTSSGSGMEILSTGLSLIQGCSDGQILKWNEATDTWGCAADAGGSGVGDDVYINGSNADGAKFIDSAATGTSAGIVWSLNTTPVPDEITLSVSNASATEAGVVTTGVQSFAGDKTFNNAATIAGLFTANGGITVEAGDTFTFNGEAFTDLTGTGLTISGGALQVANDAITDTQLAFNTGQHLTVTSSPTFAGLTANGNITIGTNSIVTGATTISSTELDVLDGGIDETEVTGAVTDVTAGSGLTGGGASGNVTLNITSANGGIAVNADNIALTLQPSGDALSTATSSGSGLEILSTGLTLLQGCSDAQVLKWNETTDTWGCAADAGGSGLGDDVLINGTNADAANFLNTTATGTSAGITWNLNTTPNPDEITLSVSNASTTEAGVVTTGTQGFSGFKTFNGGIATPIIRPVSDSTTALNIQNAAGTTNILTVDSTNARIGIGATPSHKLHVADTTTANSGTNNMAAFFNYNVDPSSLPAATTTYYGQQTFVTSSSVNLNANVTMYGDVATVQNAGSATLGAAVGTGAVAQNSGTGVITNAIAGRFKASNTGSGSITNAVALQASTPEVTAGSIGTAYGLFIETQDVSGVGTGYGIWQAGAADLNVFAGKVGIGMVPSTHALEVNGTGLFGTSVLTQTIDTYSAAALNVGTANATQINLNKNVVVAANQSLTITGGATGTRPASPTEGMVYFDTTTKQLLTYANGKWQANRAEAIIVAASNSSQADKDAADYVADGNTGAVADGDQVQINQALTAGSGKRVVLLAGTYVADATILIPNNTILSGVGQGTVIELADLDASDNLIEGSDTSTGTSVGIRDLKLDGRSDLNTAGVQRAISFTAMGGGSGSTARQGARVSYATLHRFRSESLHLSNSRNGQFTNNTIIASGSDGILVSGSSYNTFTGNLVQGGSGGAVLIGGSSTHNTFTNNTIQGNTNTGISISNSTQNTVTGNTITGGSFGVFLSTVASENTITGNTIKSTTSDSINVGTSSNNVTISGNTVMSSSASGIAVSSNSVTVSGNTISSSSSGGINITGDNNVVDGNSIAASSLYGIILNSANNTVVTNNRISDSGGATNNNGIYIFSSDSNQVAANSVTDSSATTTNYAINVNNATSDTNYLSGNTLGTGSINDAGTGTIYGGQVNNSGNYLLQPSGSIELLKNTNVTGNLTATGTLQGTQLISTVATGTAPLTVNSTTLVANLNTDLLDGQHGSFYQDASNINAGTLAVNRGGTGAGSFTQYGILFGNGTGAFGVTAAGSTGQCLLATTGAAPTWGSCASVSLQGAYDTSTGSPLITLTDNKDFSITAPDTATDSSIVFNLNCTTCSANGGRFAIQDAGVDIFRVNPNGDIIIGTSTNNVTLAAAAGYEPILNGTARHQKKIVLTAEYVGTVLDAADDTACASANSGTMISGYEAASRMNYYRWMSTQTAQAHCYDVVIQVPIPSDWAAWTSTPINVQMKKDSTGTGAYAIRVLDSTGAGDTTFCAGGGYCSPGTLGTAWANMTSTSTFAGSGYTAGDYFTIKVRMSSQSSAQVFVGNITLNYASKY